MLNATNRLFTTATQSFKLPGLPYDYGALEPVVSGEIMELHHKKHHAAYVNNLNSALDKYHIAESKGDLAQMIALQPSIKFNGGGHVNHSMFWNNLAPMKNGGGQPPSPGTELAVCIKDQFGSLEALISKFNGTTAAIQGSGWGWLGYEAQTDKLVIGTTSNQDPCSTLGLVPLLGIDVWEHAYYLQYKNARPDYLQAIWKIINWTDVTERFSAAKKK